jgi:protein-disulfide isomerase
MPFYLILGVVAVAGLGSLAWQVNKKEAASQPVDLNLTEAQLNAVQGIPMGRADAPVVIYEFADYQCPGCRQWAQFTEPLIRERLVNDGTVKYVFYDFPLPMHQHSFLAARAGRCANEQGKFWPYHDLIFGKQDEWSASSDAASLFVDYAAQAGLDRDQFDACLRSDKYQREVTESLKFGEKLGVGGTPTLFINGKRLNEAPNTFAELERMIRAEAAGVAGAAPAAAPAGAAPAPADSGAR